MNEQAGGIWVFSESRNLTFQLLNAGRRLADKAGTFVVAISTESSQNKEEYIHHGADVVFTLSNPTLNDFQADTYVDALSSLATDRNPDVILIGATRNGLELAPRLAERLKTGCITRAISLEPDAAKEFVLMDRISLGGKVIETQISRTKPQIATLSGGLPSPTADRNRKGTIVEVTATVKHPNSRIIDRTPKHADYEKTTTIICIGSALKRKEDLVVVQEFANALNASAKCTRPVADSGWMSHDQCVGFSEQIVAPEVCLACGMSGEPRDVAGIASSKLIIAINRDPDARIFRFSDYSVVANIYELLPRLSKQIRLLGNSRRSIASPKH